MAAMVLEKETETATTPSQPPGTGVDAPPAPTLMPPPAPTLMPPPDPQGPATEMDDASTSSAETVRVTHAGSGSATRPDTVDVHWKDPGLDTSSPFSRSWRTKQER